MRSLVKVVGLTLAVSVIITGCMTAEERAAIERARQEEIARQEKARAEQARIEAEKRAAIERARQEQARIEKEWQEKNAFFMPFAQKVSKACADKRFDDAKAVIAEGRKQRPDAQARNANGEILSWASLEEQVSVSIAAEEQRRIAEKKKMAARAEGWVASCTSNAYELAVSGKIKDMKNWSAVCTPEGKRIVETFAEEFLPNAYAALEKARDKALEIQAVFNEDFPTPVQKGTDTYGVYCMVLQRFAEARARYDLTNWMIAHFQLMHKCGVLTNDELVKIDEENILWNYVKVVDAAPKSLGELRGLDSKQDEFAGKFMPETYAQRQSFVKEYGQAVQLWAEMSKVRAETLAPLDVCFIAVAYKAYEIRRRSDALVQLYNDLYMQHRVGEVDAAKLAQIDGAKAAEMKSFAAGLQTMIRDVGKNPYRVVTDSMVKLPNGLMMGRTEVTQLQWNVVRYRNPSGNNYWDWEKPVVDVSWDDCREWIKELNAATGTSFRLPFEKEWEYACRAGSSGDYGWVAQGVEGKLDDIAWYKGNCGSEKLHQVATKKPNMWGLYDMHGNVREWCENNGVNRGGSWCYDAKYCTASRRDDYHPWYRDSNLGFRLAASQD